MQEEERDPCIRNAWLARSFVAFQVAQTALGTARVTIAGQNIQPPSLCRRAYTLIWPLYQKALAMCRALERRPVWFSAYGMFELDARLPLRMLALASTYMLVQLQFAFL
ncbi:hypothetical protein EVAR_2394_1 [Eumeta japonica]|uniref:Uncharacterized protein n=1 Tax=Eumeta variegata TaxID=151549 RepID=A0A4C1SNS4_EUMVA|nr:hypothetical protein EVAR_2394_1 [Eumeta japonica]